MDDKHAMQTVLPENIRHLYQQILSQGHIGEKLDDILASHRK